jgi:hypothetical protein
MSPVSPFSVAGLVRILSQLWPGRPGSEDLGSEDMAPEDIAPEDIALEDLGSEVMGQADPASASRQRIGPFDEPISNPRRKIAATRRRAAVAATEP